MKMPGFRFELKCATLQYFRGLGEIDIFPRDKSVSHITENVCIPVSSEGAERVYFAIRALTDEPADSMDLLKIVNATIMSGEDA